jgi:PAS domain S-box-containing protein
MTKRRSSHDPPKRRHRALGRVWADLPLRVKGLVVVAVPVAALVAAMGLYGVAERQDRQAQGLVLRTVEVERQIAQVRILGQTGVTGYLLTGLRGGLDRYQAANRDLPAALDRLASLVGNNPAQLARLQQVRMLAGQRVEVNEALLAGARAGDTPQRRLALLRRSGQIVDALIQQLSAMQAEQQRLLQARQTRARQAHARTVDAIALSVLLGLAGGVGAMLLFTFGIVRRVRQLEANAGRLAIGQPLHPTPHSGDVLGHLGRALDRASRLLGEREHALRQAQALLEHVVTWSPMVMIRGLLGGSKGCYVSPNAGRLLGYPPQQIAETPGFWVEHLHPEDRDRFTTALEQAIQSRAAEFEQEYRFRHHDGGFRWLYGVTRLEYDDGRLVDTLGYALDVTVRKLATDALRDREATLEAVISASPDIIAILDGDGRVGYVSQAMQRITGHPTDDRVGRNALSSELIHPDDLERFAQAHQRVLAGQDAEAMVRLRLRHADDRWIFLEAHSRPLDGGLLIVSRDVTHQVALEEDLRQAKLAAEQAKLAAEQANQAKSDYLSRMSHELRTPLNAILGFAQLLELDDLTHDQRQSLRHILAGAQHLLGLINEVLDIAAIEAGRMTLSLEPIAVADVVAETVSLIRPLANQHGILLDSPAHTCQEHVLGDRQRLRQILLNLLSNAVKYNREGGSVQVTCEQAPGERLRITVTDTGPGIATDSLEQLFVPFERLAGDQSGVEGTGLGLPLSKRLAEAMGGTLGLISSPGHGSSFWVELSLTQGPVDRDDRQQPTPPPNQQPQPPPGTALTVLCIEDNLSNLQLIERLVSHRPGVRLISAMRPQLGLELAAEHQPDLILLDLHLPDMRGDEVLRRLKASPTTAGIPVVVLTADARPGLVNRLLNQGARAFLTKPLSVQNLLGLLDTIADEQQRAGTPPPRS